MKKILSLTLLASFLIFSSHNSYGFQDQEEMEVVEATEIQEATEMQEAEVAPAPQQSVGFTQELKNRFIEGGPGFMGCLLYTSPSPRDTERSRMPSSA